MLDKARCLPLYVVSCELLLPYNTMYGMPAVCHAAVQQQPGGVREQRCCAAEARCADVPCVMIYKVVLGSPIA